MEEKQNIFSSINPFKVNIMTETAESKQQQTQPFGMENKTDKINPFLAPAVKVQSSLFATSGNTFNPFAAQKTVSQASIFSASQDPFSKSEGVKESKEEPTINPFLFKTNPPHKVQNSSTASDNPFLSSKPIKDSFGKGGIKSRLGIKKEKEIIGKTFLKQN